MKRNLLGQPVSVAGKKIQILGCSGCPLDRAPGIRKIKNIERVADKKIFVWTGVPGDEDNRRGVALSGKAGEFVWKTLEKRGIARKDVAVQNVVRCRTLDEDDRPRDPDKREMLCCSTYTEEALAQNRASAKVHFVLGDLAGSQLLGSAFNKDRPVFWHAPLDAHVVLAPLPAQVLRSTRDLPPERPSWEYQTWRDRARAIDASLNNPERWGYARSMKYEAVKTLAHFDEAERALRAEAKAGRRVSLDVEDGVVDGKPTMLLAGFGIGRFETARRWDSWNGKAWSVVLGHPEAGYEREHLSAMRERVRKLVEDPSIRKVLQNGSYDKRSFYAKHKMKLRGYDFDTMYGVFLRHSFLRSLSLETLVYRFFPEFADYKEAVGDAENYADVPLDLLVLRNGGDCDATKRIEERFSPQVDHELMQVYISAGITLDKMRHRGPILDLAQLKKADEAVPRMAALLDRELGYVTGNTNFDVNSAPCVAAYLYDELGFPLPESGKRSTDKTTLELLAVQTGHAAPDLIVKRRAVGKVKSTYLDGYERSARMHDGEIRTIWWLTGAVTGRLRSGKGEGGEKGLMNMQNLHGNPLLQNLLVSDVDWRKAL